MFGVGAACFGALGLAVVFTRQSWRALPDGVVEQIRRLPETRPNQHRVDLELRDGRVVEDVWIAWLRYPAVIGGRTIRARYRPSQVVGAVPSRSARS
jgi:hypothetical protein